ncbi:MAG: helix-turn-helix transcriptional regulator [Bacteroidetes bacterium]|nr:helix-turn-helix transcriptional regulator [Bacteroidota bacterium]
MLNHGLICQMRQQRGKSQTELSDLIQIDQATISRIENGRANLHFVTFGRIAAAMDRFVDVEMVPMEGGGINWIQKFRKLGKNYI